MSALDEWRREARAQIPRGFLRRDQGESLFISDYPRHGEEAAVSARLRDNGFTVALRGGLAGIDGKIEKYGALLGGASPPPAPAEDDSLYLWALARKIERGGGKVTEEALPTLRETLKYLDAGDWPGLYRFLSPAAALAQRRRAPLPAALGRLILRELSEKR